MRYWISGLMVAMTCALVSSAAFAAEGADGAVTFHKDVQPILQKNCQTCHRPGQSAPMSLLTYEAARPWAKAIKQAVSSFKMPPAFASPDTRHFVKNDRSLNQSEIDTLVKWADSGAPAGDLKDAPAPVQWPADGWQIKPDIIVEGPTYEVPAKTVVEWTWVAFPSNFTEDTWVTSIEILPTQPQVTHHLCLSFRPYTPDVKYWVLQLN